MSRLHNFSAGPGPLPTSVLDEVRAELLDYRGLGASLLEVSHRSKEYLAVEASARARLRRLLGLSDDWHVLFLTGGASMQFHQVPLNLRGPGQTAAYLDTGVWAAKAIREAERPLHGDDHGRVAIVASGKDDDYRAIPAAQTWTVPADAAYLHVTTNNTIYGTELHATPDLAARGAPDVPLVADASSDFLSRPIDLDAYGLVYAGAQKNLGPAGVTLVLLHDTMLGRRTAAGIAPGSLPAMLDYATHARDLFNTPPVFAVYLVEKVLAWIEAEGGVAEMDARADRKAAALYARIDRTGFYRGHAAVPDRSRMNLLFTTPSPESDARFVDEAKAAGLIGLKGHRTTGGLRASLYNAVSDADVAALVAFMDAFEARHG